MLSVESLFACRLVSRLACVATVIFALPLTESRGQSDDQPTRIEIVNALFGSGRHAEDCTTQVKQIVQHPQTETEITRDGLEVQSQGGPQYGDLRIAYTVDGRRLRNKQRKLAVLWIRNSTTVNLRRGILNHVQSLAPHNPDVLADFDPDQVEFVAPGKFEITKAIFGTGRAAAICTVQVRMIISDREAVTTISTPGLNLRNPRAYFRDVLRITYVADGRERTLVLKNGANVNLYQALLEHSAAIDTQRSAADVEIALPGTFETVRAGGGGRFLIFHIPDKNILAIVDLVERRIVKEIPLPDVVAFAANQTKLLIALPRFNQLQRWDLTTLERDDAVFLDRERPPELAVMGCAGEGPLALRCKGEVELWNVETMERLPLRDPILSSSEQFDYDMSVSADGKTICGWLEGLTGQRFHVVRVEQDSVVEKAQTDAHNRNGRWAIPTADGSLLLRYGGGAYRYDMTPIPMPEREPQFHVPTDDPRYVIRIKFVEGTKSLQPTICSASDLQPIYELAPFEDIHDPRTRRSESRLAGEQRFRYLPKHNLVAALPVTCDRVVVRRFDLEKTLETAGESYLFVNSKPPATLEIGETFVYQLTALSGSPVEYSLDSGPEGMSVTPDGKVIWKAGEQHRADVANVIISAKNDEGDQAFQSFEIFLKRRGRTVVAGLTDSATDEKMQPPSLPSNPGADTSDTRSTAFDEEALVVVRGNHETVLELPGKFGCVRSGGAGRFLIFHIPDRQSIVLLDVADQEILKEIEVPDDLVFAANRTKLLIALPTEGRLERWDLAKLVREKTAPLPPDNLPTLAVMGADGDGPLALWGQGSVQLWDVDSMSPLSERGDRIIVGTGGELRMSVSADGQTFCGWLHGISSQRFKAMRVHPRSTSVIQSPDVHSMHDRWVMPVANGSHLLRYDGKSYSRDFEQQAANVPEGTVVVPTHDPRFVLEVRSQDRQHAQVSVSSAADSFSLATLLDVEGISPRSAVMFEGEGCEPRVNYVPDASCFVFLPESDDRVIFRKLDLEAELGRASSDYLVVTSSPPPLAFVGETYRYQMQAFASAKGPVEYSLVTGPAGMSIDGPGTLEWQVDSRPGSGVVRVVVEATAGEAQFQHAFEIAVERDLERLYDVNSHGRAARDGFVRLDDLRLELPASSSSITYGLDGRMLVLCGRHLAILSADGWTVESTAELDKSYQSIGERSDYFVAVSDQPNGIYLIDKATYEVEKFFRLSGRVRSLTLHPSLPISYVALERRGELPHYRFVIYDEEAGEGREDDEWVGNWIEVSRNGDYLITGYSDLYRDGAELLLNPTRWHVVPKYGSLDWLIRYRLNRTGEPRLEDIKQGVGGNGKGIRLSKDGKRVTYLSHTGSPDGSRNLAAWDPTDFSKIPISYEIKNRGSPRVLAFHPSLPLVATGANGVVTLLHRETAEPQDEVLPRELSEVGDISDFKIAFSPDGRHLILEGRINGIDYLHRYTLKLTDRQIRRLEVKGKHE